MKKLKLFESFINETDQQWLGKFFAFLDYPWQEDAEIDIVTQLSEYRDRMDKDPKAAHSYLTVWHDTNKEMLDRVLAIRTSDKFATELDELIKG